MHRWVCGLLFVAACDRVAPRARPIAVGIAVAAVDAAAPPLTCSEPRALTQLGTLHEEVRWRGDVVVGKKHAYDPETLAEVPPPPEPIPAPVPRDVLASGERVVATTNAISAGAAWSLALRAGEKFEGVEAGRWVVLRGPELVENGLGPKTPALRVVDGTTGKPDARKFVAVSGDFAASDVRSAGAVTVWNLATRAAVLNEPPCAAGGTFAWSLRPGFLVCSSNRGGESDFDLRTGKETHVTGAAVAPDFVVHVPYVNVWDGVLLGGDSVTYERLDRGGSVILSTDVPNETLPSANANDPAIALKTAVPVAFCGAAAKLFAFVDRHQLVVCRGSDGKRLATAPAMPGGNLVFSPSGRYVLHERAGAATVFRLDP